MFRGNAAGRGGAVGFSCNLRVEAASVGHVHLPAGNKKYYLK